MVLRHAEHHFNLQCLPAAYYGPLKNAPVVLLFLSPGFDISDLDHANSIEGQTWYASQRSGTAPLPTEQDHAALFQWWTGICRPFRLDPDQIRHKLAILNLGAYKSVDFRDWHMLSALPSSRKALDWVQSVLFPQAEGGERVVVCLRSAKHWGLRTAEGGPYGEALFAPSVTRAGHMLHGDLRERIIRVIQARLRG